MVWLTQRVVLEAGAAASTSRSSEPAAYRASWCHRPLPSPSSPWMDIATVQGEGHRQLLILQPGPSLLELVVAALSPSAEFLLVAGSDSRPPKHQGNKGRSIE